MTDSANTTSPVAATEKFDEADNDNKEELCWEDQLRYDAINAELRNLSDWHRMRERCGFVEDENGVVVKKAAGRTRTLKLHHLEDFSDDDYREAFCKGEQNNNDNNEDSESFRRFRIFNQFARSVCHMKAIARKEIFEAWATALYVHETFLSTKSMARRRKKAPIKRFADLVCSHGLLSWALLLLASSDEEREGLQQSTETASCSTQQHQTEFQNERPMTGVCIDIDMPKSSETAAGIFFNDFPQFCNDTSPEGSQQISHSRWDYVEGPVENLVPHESTLLVGIHACGRLSDTIIAQAISANAPLALLPCCHSKKILTADQKKGFQLFTASQQCVPATTGKSSYSLADTLADYTDSLRKQRLIDAGYDVREVWIPEEFTLKNRVILAIPPLQATPAASEAAAQLKSRKRNSWGIQYFPIPLEDAPEARAAIRSIAGRVPAVERYNEAHPPPSLGFNVWLPKENAPETTDGEEKQSEKSSGGNSGGTRFTVESLQRVLDQIRSENATSDDALGPAVKVEDATKKVYHNPDDGRLSKTFRVHYLDCRDNKARARELHKTLKEVTIPLHFPTVTVR